MPTTYPTSIDTFTTKTDGVSDVLAEDVNKLQGAVVAIETKLGSGTTIPNAALGSGTANSTTFLRGDRTWSAPGYLCRAWVNFNATRNVTDTGPSTNGQPVFIRGSGNVTSVVKNGVGDFTINFTTAMPSANYCVTFGVNNFGLDDAGDSNLTLWGNNTNASMSAASLRIDCRAEQAGAAPRDCAFGFVSCIY